VDPLHEIEELVAFEGRWPGTDAERRAAAHLADRLRSLGREADVEPTSVWPNYPITHAIHAVLAIVGSVVSVYSAVAGTALVLFAAFSTFGDLTGSFYLVRRLTGRRASQNVMSREREGKPGKLVLVAHYDAARTGAVFSRRALERWAVLGKLIRRPIGPFEPFFWSMMVILVCSAVRLLDVQSTPLTVVQFIPTVILIASVPLLVDIALSGVVPGASDNASGVATIMRLAERYGGELQHFDVWVAFPGAEEAFLLGMRELVRKHRRELDRERTVYLNVDIVGSGTVRYLTKEGLVIAYRYHPTLVDLCDRIRDADEEENRFGARGMVERLASDALAARAAGYPAITISCRNALDYAPNYHQPTDTPDRIELEALERAYGFCSELIERLDESVGPDLERDTKETVLAEEEDA
jgi:peptidase M28-like protein